MRQFHRGRTCIRSVKDDVVCGRANLFRNPVRFIITGGKVRRCPWKHPDPGTQTARFAPRCANLCHCPVMPSIMTGTVRTVRENKHPGTQTDTLLPRSDDLSQSGLVSKLGRSEQSVSTPCVSVWQMCSSALTLNFTVSFNHCLVDYRMQSW